jgi:hypothetical protein
MHRFEALTNAVGIRCGVADDAHDCRMYTWPYLPDVQVGNPRVARLFHPFPDLRGNLLVGRLQQAHDRLDSMPMPRDTSARISAEAKPPRSPTLPVPKLKRGLDAWRRA